MKKLIDVLTLSQLKGSRSNWGLVAGAGAWLLEGSGKVAPGTFTQYQELWFLAMTYFIKEHLAK